MLEPFNPHGTDSDQRLLLSLLKCFSQEQAEKFLQFLDSPVLYSYAARSRTDGNGKIGHVSEYQRERMISLQLRWNGQIMNLDTPPYQAFHRIITHYNATRQPDEVELPLIPLYGLRHTAATLLIANGVDVCTVSGRLGHANTSTTLNIYSHALEEFDRKAAELLEQVLTVKKA